MEGRGLRRSWRSCAWCWEGTLCWVCEVRLDGRELRRLGGCGDESGWCFADSTRQALADL